MELDLNNPYLTVPLASQPASQLLVIFLCFLRPQPQSLFGLVHPESQTTISPVLFPSIGIIPSFAQSLELRFYVHGNLLARLTKVTTSHVLREKRDETHYEYEPD